MINSFWHHFTIAVVTPTSMLGPNVIYVLEVPSMHHKSFLFCLLWWSPGIPIRETVLEWLFLETTICIVLLCQLEATKPSNHRYEFYSPDRLEFSCLLCIYWLRDSLTTARAAHEMCSCRHLCFWRMDVANLQTRVWFFLS